MLDFIKFIKNIHPGIFVHSVYLEEDLQKDQRAAIVRGISGIPVCAKKKKLKVFSVRERQQPSGGCCAAAF